MSLASACKEFVPSEITIAPDSPFLVDSKAEKLV